MNLTPGVWALVILVLYVALYFLGLRWFGRRTPAPSNTTQDTSSAAPTQAGLDASKQKEKFELLKLEYEKAADRYDNIYKAVWQNFSYLALLAGGLLTFGSKGLERWELSFLALTPLLFWFMATFLPMDHYGQKTRARLAEIESEISAIYFPPPTEPKLRHFIAFTEGGFIWRVRDMVRLFGGVISVAWFITLFFAVEEFASPSPTSQTLQLQADPFRIEIVDPELQKVRSAFDSVTHSLRTRDSVASIRLDRIESYLKNLH